MLSALCTKILTFAPDSLGTPGTGHAHITAQEILTEKMDEQTTTPRVRTGIPTGHTRKLRLRGFISPKHCH